MENSPKKYIEITNLTLKRKWTFCSVI